MEPSNNNTEEQSDSETESNELCRSFQESASSSTSHEQDCGQQDRSNRVSKPAEETCKAKGSNYKCEECNITFPTASKLKVHRKAHTGEKAYYCQICGSPFAHRHTLLTHMLTHSTKAPKCQSCGKSFATSDTLRVHMKKHTGERPYKCTVCGKSYLYNSNLSQHKRIHTKERKYKCTLCAFSFVRCDSLASHMRTHNGEKPFKCTRCGEAFAHNCSLTYHNKKHCVVIGRGKLK